VVIECGNCHKKMTTIFKDKVSNKLVCQECMKQSIDLEIRFTFDFEKL
jgi:protein-arginine kinase activator protein McsA